MIPILLLAAAISVAPDSIIYRAVVRPESAVFEFPVQYDTAWAIGNTGALANTAEYEWTVSTVVRDTVFSFGYLLFKESYPGAPAGAIKFADARARFGDRRLFTNGSVDQTVAVDVAFEASLVVVRLNDTATIRRIFVLKPKSVQFSHRLPGRQRETIDVPVEYGEEAVVSKQPDDAPDSTYLRLVLDLADVGTFSYDLMSTERLGSMRNEIRNVDVKDCMLSLQTWVEPMQSGFPRNFVAKKLAIPLDAIDPKWLTIRAKRPDGNYRYDPPPWLLQVAVKSQAKSTIMVGNIQSNDNVPTRRIDLELRDLETASLVKGWLIDASNRCGSWNTAPLKPIR